MDPAIFLDRDGTLVPENAAEVDASKLAPLGGVTDALKRLRESGFRLVVATNQGAVARGRSSEAEVDALNQRVGALIDGRTGIARTIERFYYCPFDPKGTVPEYSREHPWRKPNPGMLRQAARDMSLDLARSWLIGGSPNDIAAGRAAGVRTVLVSRELAHIAEAAADFTAANMADAVAIVLKHQADRPKQRPEAAAAQPAPARAAAGATATVTRPRTRKSATERLRRARNGERLRRALGELAEEVRALRLRRAETGSLRIAAMALQLATLLVAAVAIISLAEPEAFLRWSVGAVFLQLATATVLLFDRS